eukprot:PhM_4_TR14883/c0_g1_i1/m.107116/K02357/tsf, TSFM; elongation factor Ts
MLFRRSMCMRNAAAPTGNDRRELIRTLREMTEASLSDVATAIKECGGDIPKCVDWLRAKGAAKIVKKASREANQGLLLAGAFPGYAYVAEVSCETDFAARSPTFIKFCETVRSKFTADAKNLDCMETFTGEMRERLTDDLAMATAAIGERMELRKVKVLTNDNAATAFGFYTHSFAQGGSGLADAGSVAALVSLTLPSADVAPAGEKAAKALARHMIATMGAYSDTDKAVPQLAAQNFMGDGDVIAAWVQKQVAKDTTVRQNVLVKLGE